MTQALLDFPVARALAGDFSRLSQALLDFSRLLASEGLDPVQFLSGEEYLELYQDIVPRLPGGSPAIFRLINNMVRWEGPDCEATPRKIVTELSATWKRGLRDSLDLGDWRSPQIVYPNIWSSRWDQREPEIEINLEPCGQPQTESAIVSRVLVKLEEYSNHRYASSDHDPWDVRRDQASQHAHSAATHPRILPKPPDVIGVALPELRHLLEELGCGIDENRYYYIPPAEWDPMAVGQADWRRPRGGAFPRGVLNGRDGWLDKNGYVWHWDLTHVYGHWDVQLPDGTRRNISHQGEHR